MNPKAPKQHELLDEYWRRLGGSFVKTWYKRACDRGEKCGAKWVAGWRLGLDTNSLVAVYE